MKLSEAIRKGSAGMKQVVGLGVPPKSGCALQAAVQGYFGRWYMWPLRLMGFDHTTFLPKFIPIVHEARLCPACHHENSWQRVGRIVGHLNDDHGWSFEQIADWVETVEPPA